MINPWIYGLIIAFAALVILYPGDVENLSYYLELQARRLYIEWRLLWLRFYLLFRIKFDIFFLLVRLKLLKWKNRDGPARGD